MEEDGQTSICLPACRIIQTGTLSTSSPLAALNSKGSVINSDIFKLLRTEDVPLDSLKALQPVRSSATEIAM